MGDDDFAKPQIGVGSSRNEITPCNLSLDRLAKAVKDGVSPRALTRWSSARSRCPTGSRWATRACTSLVSREVIADSVETVMQAERLDGSVLLAGCDKSLPGMLMAAAWLDPAASSLCRLDPAGLAAVGRHRARSHDHRRIPRPSAPAPAGDAAKTSTPSSARSVREVPAAACTPPTRWPAPPRRLACRCRAARPACHRPPP